MVVDIENKIFQHEKSLAIEKMEQIRRDIPKLLENIEELNYILEKNDKIGELFDDTFNFRINSNSYSSDFLYFEEEGFYNLGTEYNSFYLLQQILKDTEKTFGLNQKQKIIYDSADLLPNPITKYNYFIGRNSFKRYIDKDIIQVENNNGDYDEFKLVACFVTPMIEEVESFETIGYNGVMFFYIIPANPSEKLMKYAIEKTGDYEQVPIEEIMRDETFICQILEDALMDYDIAREKANVIYLEMSDRKKKIDELILSIKKSLPDYIEEINKKLNINDK